MVIILDFNPTRDIPITLFCSAFLFIYYKKIHKPKVDKIVNPLEEAGIIPIGGIFFKNVKAKN